MIGNLCNHFIIIQFHIISNLTSLFGACSVTDAIMFIHAHQTIKSTY